MLGSGITPVKKMSPFTCRLSVSPAKEVPSSVVSVTPIRENYPVPMLMLPLMFDMSVKGAERLLTGPWVLVESEAE